MITELSIFKGEHSFAAVYLFMHLLSVVLLKPRTYRSLPIKTIRERIRKSCIYQDSGEKEKMCQHA